MFRTVSLAAEERRPVKPVARSQAIAALAIHASNLQLFFTFASQCRADGLRATRADNAKSRFARAGQRASYRAGAARVRKACHRLGTGNAAARGCTRLDD